MAVACFTRALAGEQEQATLELYDGDDLVAVREPEVRVRREAGGRSAAGELRLAQVLGANLDGVERLTASWADGEAVVAAR